MADIYERHEGSASTDKDGIRTYTRVFRINTLNASLLSEWGILGISIFRYDAYPTDAGALAVSATSVPVAGELGIFDVSYTYSSAPFDVGSADDAGSAGGMDQAEVSTPTSRTATVRFSTNTRMVPFLKDWDTPRKPVMNSAGQPFEGQEVEDCTQLITVSINLPASISLSVKEGQYLNRVNNADFAPVPVYGSYPAGTLRCNNYGGLLANEPGFGWYIQAEIELEYKWDGWHRKYLDQGYYYKVAGKYDTDGNQVVRKFRDNAVGQPLDAPRFLNGAGLPLPDGDDPVELTFYPYQWASFTNLYT